MGSLATDFRYAMRQLRRSPGFTLTAILTLTTAIAANVVAFGVVDALLLHPLAAREPGRLVEVQKRHEGGGLNLSYPTYRDLRDRNRSFSALAAPRITRVGFGVNGNTEPVWGYEVSEDAKPALFWPVLQNPRAGTVLIVEFPKSQRDPAEIAGAMRRAIAQLDGGMPVFTIASWTDALGLVAFPAGAATIVLGSLAIMLAVTGIFGLASYTVSRRMRELGIRVALGAQGRQVLRAALGRTAVLLSVGSVIGLLLGFATTRLLAGIVYQASASDPVVVVAVVLTMALLGAISSALPARRALRVDPMVLLRAD